MEYVTTQGVEVPALGLGTARFDSTDVCRRAVEAALDIGYRHVDTAQIYGTEGAVGAAVSTAAVDRDDVFVTTKLSESNRSRDRVLESTRQSLAALRTDYVDLLLMHSPNSTVPLAETIGAMNDLRDEGIVRHVGVSNFSVDQLRRAMERSDAPILTNQVEYHPYRDQSALLETCIDEGVVLTAYSPLAVGKVTSNATLAEIGDRYGKTAAQVALRWLLQQEMVAAIPKAAGRDHLRENFDVFDFALADDEMRAVFEGTGGPIDGLRDRLGL
ncbi:aldo/keto reductase [Halomarina halobia]|uniref:Aldo/keto reductase n=1 Tax=Halomarina halobia TaxID=3033386 RepID=A0ABD6AA25_9EURY|nr:aldo/keto reductase [Halomarina sp. PSR21]